MIAVPQRPVEFPRQRARRDAPAIGAAADFPEALRRLPRNVCVIAFEHGERLFGLTATSVSPLSLDPATLLVGVPRRWPVAQQFLASRSFGVSALAADQDALAERFSAGAAIGERERREGGWIGFETAAPTLADATAAFACERDAVFEHRGGAVVIARVLSVRASSGSSALVSWQGVYSQLGWTKDEISRATGQSPVRTKERAVAPFPQRSS